MDTLQKAWQLKLGLYESNSRFLADSRLNLSLPVPFLGFHSHSRSYVVGTLSMWLV